MIHKDKKSKREVHFKVEKIKKYDWILWAIVAVGLFAVKMFLPKAGKYALLDSGITAVICIGVTVYFIVKAVSKKLSFKEGAMTYIIIAVFAVFSVIIAKNVVIDLLIGPQELTLHNIEVYESTSSGKYGTTKSYYFTGYDESGEDYRIDINKEDGYRIVSADKVTFKWYENVKKFYEFVEIE